MMQRTKKTIRHLKKIIAMFFLLKYDGVPSELLFFMKTTQKIAFSKGRMTFTYAFERFLQPL